MPSRERTVQKAPPSSDLGFPDLAFPRSGRTEVTTIATDDAFDKKMTSKALPSSAMTEVGTVFTDNCAIPMPSLAGSMRTSREDERNRQNADRGPPAASHRPLQEPQARQKPHAVMDLDGRQIHSRCH